MLNRFERGTKFQEMKKVNQQLAIAANDAQFKTAFPELANELGMTAEENAAFAEMVSNLPVGLMAKAKSFVVGTVVQRTKDGIYVNIGTKFDAFCAAEEAGELKEGDKAGFWVLDQADYEKSAVVSHAKYLGWKHLDELKESGEVTTVRAFFVAKDKRTQRVAGLRVVFDHGAMKGIRGFIPYKETNDRRNIENMLNQTLEVVVIKSNPHNGPFGDLVLSNMQAMAAHSRSLVAQLEAGYIVEGTVKKILNLEEGEKGVLVELCDGLTGIMYSRDITSVPGKSIADIIKVGEVRNFEVKRVDHKIGKVWLATKRLDKIEFAKKIAKDQTYTGKVVRSYEYGVFVNIGSDINGLVHISDIKKAGFSDDKSIKIGDTVTVKVKSVDEARERIALQLISRA
jgi:4-hydroxy-3-methylbut-2-en-1-yl diphosphate reductase